MPSAYIQSDWRDMLHIICYSICYACLSTITPNYCLIYIDTLSIYIYMKNIIIPINLSLVVHKTLLIFLERYSILPFPILLLITFSLIEHK